MGVSEYRLAEVLPEGFAELLPLQEDIEKRMREGASAAAVAQFASEEKTSWTSLN